MKRFLLCLSLLAALSAGAKSLVVQLKNGTTACYLISPTSEPVMRLGSDGFTIGLDSYTFTQVSHFTFTASDEPASIATPQAEGFRLANDVLSCPAEGTLYSADGRTIASGTTICLDGLPAGTYIVSCQGQSMKFIKK